MEAALEKKFKGVQDQLADAQKNGASKEEVQKLHDSIEKQGNSLEELVKSQEKKVIDSISKQFKSFTEENHEEIKSIYKKGSGEIEFIPKVVGSMTTDSGSNATTPSQLMHADLNNISLRNDSGLLNLFSVSETGDARFSYTEATPKDGDFTFVDEGGTKPQMDFKWVNRFPEPKKAAGIEILTEESVTDVKRLQSVAETFLRDKHDLFKVKGLFFADGTSEKPLGVTAAARTFVAGQMADAFEYGNINFMDIVNAISTDIYTTTNYDDEPNPMPNLAMVSPIDFFLKIVSAKDDRGMPLYPQASLFNVVNLGGMTVRPWVSIPQGKIFVGDVKKSHVVNYVPYSLRVGWINEQFITNKFTLVGESRYFQYIKNLDLAAFVYDDIATVKTALEQTAPA